MTRAEYNEFRYIRSYERQFDLGPGTCLTIRTDGSASYKKSLHDLYTGWGFHPASVRVDSRMFDEKERIRCGNDTTESVYDNRGFIAL